MQVKSGVVWENRAGNFNTEKMAQWEGVESWLQLKRTWASVVIAFQWRKMAAARFKKAETTKRLGMG